MILNNHYLQIKNIYFYIFSAYLLLGLHIAIPHLGGHGLYLPFNIIGWIFIAFIMGLSCYQISKNKKIVITKIMVYNVIGSILLIIPLFYTNNEYSHLATMRILGLLSGIFLFFSFHQFGFTKNENHRALYIVLGSAMIQSIIRVIDEFFPKIDLFLIFLDSNFNAMAQNNIYATFLTTNILISLYLIFKDENLDNSLWKKILVYTIPFLACIQLIQLQSRTGYLSFFIGTGFTIFFGIRKNKNFSFWVIALFIGLIIGLSSYRISRINKELEYSINTRLTTYSLTFDMIKNNPISGIGYGAFLSSFRHYYAKEKEKNRLLETIGNNNMSHPHNEILFWTVEGGVLPFIGLLIISGGFIALIWNTKQKKAWFMIGMTIPILLHTQLELPFYISLIHWFIFIFLLYMLDDQFGTKFELNIALLSPFRIFSIVIPSTVTFYMLTTLESAKLITEFERTGYKNPTLLVSIPNPHAWQKKYETLIMKLNLEIAKKTKDITKLNKYINWAENYIKHSPYLFIYYDLATAYETIGNGEKAWEIYNIGKYLYPGAKWRDNP